MTEKYCHRCGMSKARSLFNRDAKKKDKLQTQCRDCKHIAQRLDYNKKPEIYLQRQRERRAEDPRRQRAHSAVHRAVKKGTLIRPVACSLCGRTSQRIEAHHHKGYELEFILDVIFVCTSCHRTEENK